MSVCFYVPADQGGASGVAEEIETEVSEEITSNDGGLQTLQQFWTKVTEDIKKVTFEDFKTQALPLARIKKIMKLDEEVKMISGEAPVLFAKAAEIFIHELTLRAWSHTEDNKRRTLQRNDIAMAISKSDQFDFLIDIVPRHEVKVTKPMQDPLHSNHASEQLTQQPTTSLQSSSQQHVVIQPCAQVVQNQQNIKKEGVAVWVSSQADESSAGSSSGLSQQPVTLMQHVVTPSGDIQQLPIQLTQAQLNMIRLQVQNNPNQPIIIQAQPQSPQIIQVSSQAQHQPQQQVFLAQVATTQDDS